MKKKMSNKANGDEEIDNHPSYDNENQTTKSPDIKDNSNAIQFESNLPPKCQHYDRQNSNSMSLLDNYCAWCEMLEHEKQKACVKLIAEKHIPPKLIMNQDLITHKKSEDFTFQGNNKIIQDHEKQEQYSIKNNSNKCQDYKVPNFAIDQTTKYLLDDAKLKMHLPLHVENGTQMTPKRVNPRKIYSTDDPQDNNKMHSLMETMDETSLGAFAKFFKEYLKTQQTDHTIDEKKKCCCNCKCSKSKTSKKRPKSDRKSDRNFIIEAKGDVSGQNMDNNIDLHKHNHNVSLRSAIKNGDDSILMPDNIEPSQISNELDECRQVIVALDQVCNQYKQIVANCYKKLNTWQTKEQGLKPNQDSNNASTQPETSSQEVHHFPEEVNPAEFYQNFMKKNMEQYELFKAANKNVPHPNTGGTHVLSGYSVSNYGLAKPKGKVSVNPENQEQSDTQAHLQKSLNSSNRCKKSLIEEFQDYLKKQNLSTKETIHSTPARTIFCDKEDKGHYPSNQDTNYFSDYAKPKDNNQSRCSFGNYSRVGWPFYDC